MKMFTTRLRKKIEKRLGRKLTDDERIAFQLGYLELTHDNHLQATSLAYNDALGDLSLYE